VRSLYQELALYPKPGLVSLVDTGSHDDMDASTFVRSLFSLRRYSSTSRWRVPAAMISPCCVASASRRSGACWWRPAASTRIAARSSLNLLHRGGADGLHWARSQAATFIADGGAYAVGWRPRLQQLGDAFVARRLSPGGSADLLACSWFLLQQEAV
jgi:triphosphoribosyl-dephospho-CoA synthetase